MATTTRTGPGENESRPGPDHEPSPREELTALLWVIAALLAAYVLVLWVFGHMLSI